jgi:hypothetical protein
MIAHAPVAPRLLDWRHRVKGEFMANERDRDQDDLERVGEGFGGVRKGESQDDRVGGKSEENVRGTADDMEDDDEFDDSDDLDDEDEEEEGK